MSELAKWYVVHTYSGYENSVAANILKAAENRKMQDLIQEVNIPMETVKEITDSGEKTVERKVFPGYVLVKMVLTERGANGGCGSCFACRDLQLNVTGDLLCHERHLLNIECGNDRRFRPPLARLNVSPTFAAYAAHRF